MTQPWLETIRCRNCECPFRLRRECSQRHAVIHFCPACHEVEYRDERQPIPDEDGHVVWGNEIPILHQNVHKKYKTTVIYMALRAIKEYILCTYTESEGSWQEQIWDILRENYLKRGADEMDFKQAIREIKIICEMSGEKKINQLSAIGSICNEALRDEKQEGLGINRKDVQSVQDDYESTTVDD